MKSQAREAVLPGSQQLVGNTPDNSGPEPGRKTIFSAPASIIVGTERRERRRAGCGNRARDQRRKSRFQNISAVGAKLKKKPKQNNKPTCVLQEKHCPRTVSRESARSPAPPKDEVFRVKILEWMRVSLLRRSALLGRPDCNESSQTKRDLLAAPGEPAQATLSAWNTSFAPRVGELLGAETTAAAWTLIRPSSYYLPVSLNADLDWWTVNRGCIRGALQPSFPEARRSLRTRGNPQRPLFSSPPNNLSKDAFAHGIVWLTCSQG